MTEPSAPPSAPAAYPRTELPAGFETVLHSGEGGARLRTVHWDSGDDSRPPILFMGGKRDFIERHAESFQRIRARGHRLAALDWRDQGLSSRASCASCDLFDMMDVPRENLQLIVNRAEKKMFQSIGVHEVADTLHRNVSATIAKDKAGLESAQDQGVLLGEINKKAPFVRDVARLAEQMCQRHGGQA